MSCWYEPNSDFHDNTIGHLECQHFFNGFSLFQIWFLIKFVLKMNSRRKGTGSEVTITSTMIWDKIVGTSDPYAHILGWYSCFFFFNVIYDSDNCL
jgi:hypothetical protein